jgi:hypothetical protein
MMPTKNIIKALARKNSLPTQLEKEMTEIKGNESTQRMGVLRSDPIDIATFSLRKTKSLEDQPSYSNNYFHVGSYKSGKNAAKTEFALNKLEALSLSPRVDVLTEVSSPLEEGIPSRRRIHK